MFNNELHRLKLIFNEIIAIDPIQLYTEHTDEQVSVENSGVSPSQNLGFAVQRRKKKDQGVRSYQIEFSFFESRSYLPYIKVILLKVRFLFDYFYYMQEVRIKVFLLVEEKEKFSCMIK